MCYFINNKNITVAKEEQELAEFKDYLKSYIVAPEAPIIPIITDQSEHLTLATWRFKPEIEITSKTRSIGLNIQSENALKTPMFKDFTFNHCIIPINGFFEWKHFKNHSIKVKHYITMEKEKTFYLAGLWRFYDKNKIAFGVLTTKANELMSDIHNSKLRMPIALNLKQAQKFLVTESLSDFEFPNLNPLLLAENLEPNKVPTTLFD